MKRDDVKWTEEDGKLAQQLRDQGSEYSEIATRLGRTSKAVQAKVFAMSRTPEQRQAIADTRRGVAVAQINRRDVPDDVAQRRVDYINAPYRDLTGAHFGDPKRGYSALDLRGLA